MSSALDILAIVFFAPNCFAIKQVIKLVVSDVVNETTKSELWAFASFRIDIDAESPSIVLISSWLSATFKFDFLLSINVISCDSNDNNFAK